MIARQTSRDWLARLVAVDTTSRHSNLPCIDLIETFLADRGIAATRVPSDDGDKANLFFTIGPIVPGGVVLSAHTDVVPVDGQHWTSDPWTLVERDGRLYGRGTADMKGFIATVLAAVPAMQTAGLARPIHVALSYDEEVGLFGAPRMIAAMTRTLPPPAAVIVGEPTRMAVVDRHKGILGFRTTVTGHEAHSSQTHLGVSAIMVAARLMARIDDIARRLERDGRPDNGFVPAHPTVTIGLVSGGSAPNILARDCTFVWDVRAADPDEGHAIADEVADVARSLEAEMRARFDDCRIVTEMLADVPPLRAAADSPAVTLGLRLSETNACEAAAYVAEAGQFQSAGHSTIICGPGSIAQAHQPDEFIAVAQLAAGDAFIARLIAELSR